MRKESKSISKSILKQLKGNEEVLKLTNFPILDYGYPESKCNFLKKMILNQASYYLYFSLSHEFKNSP
jgi:hypothetical protein